MAKRVSRGGSPRGPRPGRKSESSSLRTRKERPKESPRSLSVRASITGSPRSIIPPWELSSEEERLWRLIVPELQRLGAAEPLDAVTISSIISGVVLERRTVEDILSGAAEMVLTGKSGNGYMNPLIAGYLSIRKSNLAAMAEAGMTRSRRGVREDASLVAAVEAERLTQVHEQVKLLVKGTMRGDDDGGKKSVRDDDPPTMSGGDAPL